MIERYRQTLRKVQAHPGGFLVEDTLASHIAFALAMDEGAAGDLLTGFHEFLVARIGVATAWWWPGLTRWLTEPRGPKGRGTGHLPEDLNQAATNRWYELLDEHLSARAAEEQEGAAGTGQQKVSNTAANGRPPSAADGTDAEAHASGWE